MAGTCSTTLGNSRTNAYVFGASEMRIGNLANILKLDSSHSIGVLDSVEISFNREFADLRGGRGNQMLAKGLSQADLTVTATASEATYRNMSLMLGNGIAEPTFVANTVPTSGQVVGDTEVSTAAALGVVANDYIAIHDCDNAALLQIVRVATVDASGLVITLDADTPLLNPVNVTDVVHKLEFNSMKPACSEEYLTCQILLDSIDSDTPRIFLGFYGTITSSLQYSQTSNDFGQMSLQMDFYQVPGNLYGAGGIMQHAAHLITTHGQGSISTTQ